jgi:Transposase
VASDHFDNRGRREWWFVHVEAWQRSGLTQTKYCAQHGLVRNTFARWLGVLTDAKMAKIRVERVRSERRRSAPKTGFVLSTDKRSHAVQAFWAMHVEALNWSGMSVRQYARAMRISPWTLSKWRDLIAAEEVVIDWRGQLHPSARPKISTNISTSASSADSVYVLTGANEGAARPNRRSFTDEEKRAIVMETLHAGVSVSSVARRHGIVTSMLFRWRVQLGFGGDDSAQLVLVHVLEPQHETVP